MSDLFTIETVRGEQVSAVEVPASAIVGVPFEVIQSPSGYVVALKETLVADLYRLELPPETIEEMVKSLTLILVDDFYYANCHRT